MRSRLAKYAPRPWLVALSAIIAFSLVVIRLACFPGYTAGVYLHLSEAALRYGTGGLPGVTDRLPVTESISTESAMRLAERIESPMVVAGALRQLQASSGLRQVLEKREPRAAAAFSVADRSPSYQAFQEAVAMSRIQMDREAIERLVSLIEIPESDWADFLYLESLIRKHQIKPEVFDTDQSENRRYWLHRTRARVISAGSVFLEVSDHNPRRAEIVANALTVTISRQIEDEALDSTLRARQWYQDRLRGEWIKAQSISRQVMRSSHSGAPNPPLSWQMDLALDRVEVATQHLARIDALHQAARVGLINVRNWAGTGSTATRHEVPAYRDWPFATPLHYLVWGFLLTGVSWILALFLHLLSLVFRSTIGSRLVRHGKPVAVAPTDTDF